MKISKNELREIIREEIKLMEGGRIVKSVYTKEIRALVPEEYYQTADPEVINQREMILYDIAHSLNDIYKKYGIDMRFTARKSFSKKYRSLKAFPLR